MQSASFTFRNNSFRKLKSAEDFNKVYYNKGEREDAYAFSITGNDLPVIEKNKNKLLRVVYRFLTLTLFTLYCISYSVINVFRRLFNTDKSTVLKKATE